MTTIGCLAAALALSVVSMTPAAASTAAARGSGHHAAGKCPVDHHTYASAKSAKRDGTSVKVKVLLGKKKCGLDDGVYKFGKHVKTLTVPKGAVVKVLKNIMKTNVPSRIPVSRLPHYVNRDISKNDDNIFQVVGPHSAVKKFDQVFIS